MEGNAKFEVVHLPVFGVEVFGIDITQNIGLQEIDEIKKLVEKESLVVFRNQKAITGDSQVEISKWFGEVDDVVEGYRHKNSPNSSILRVSNDAEEGLVGVGRTGWHIDGSFLDRPGSHSIYYIVSAPSEGSTGMLMTMCNRAFQFPLLHDRQPPHRLYLAKPSGCKSDESAKIEVE